MKKILVVSWFFPPVNSSEGLVTYKLLNNSKYDYDVYTQNNNNLWSYKQSDDLIVNKNINRIYSDATTLKEFKEKALEYFANNYENYDIVMTRSMPEECHEIGLAIKQIKPDVKWIASFGDPISQNPFTLKSLNFSNPYSLKSRYDRPFSFKEIFSLKRILKSFIYNRRNKSIKKQYLLKNDDLQKQIINLCDYVIYNSDYQQDYMLKNYKNNVSLKEKSLILPHSYDEKLYPKVKKNVKNEKIVFSYVGHLDDIRTPRLIFESIKELKEDFEDLPQKVEFDFYGNLSDNDKLYLLNNDLLDVVHIKKNVTYLESLKVMQESDWLIHVDANLADIIPENIFFAAKIADYLGTGNKIFALTMLEGISAEILRKNNALVVTYSKENVKNYLYLILYKNYNFSMSKDARQEYNVKNVAQKFDEFIEKITVE